MYNMKSIEDTIAAIATPLGTGGVGIVRISGKEAFNVVSRMFSQKLETKKLPEFKPNRIYHGWILDENNPVDEVIVLSFKAPHSYTGEDVAEIQCHGGVNVTKHILKLCLESGARLADRGEFTKKAFFNKKLDLSQVEAVIDLINSKTDRFSQVSAHNLSGKLASYIKELRQELIDLLSVIIAAIDFPEEVPEPEYSFIEEKIQKITNRIDYVLESTKNSDLMRNGIKLAIAGKPNVGKSSFFNALLNLERAIVTDIPGTTRDVIQESIDIAGIPVTLIDTAGIRELESNKGSDYIESIGINMSKSYIKDADVVLFLYDLTQGVQEEDRVIFDEVKDKPLIVVGSKADLVEPDSVINEIQDKDIVLISSKDRKGLEEIKKQVEQLIFSENLSVNDEFSTNTRQRESLTNAKKALLHARESCENMEIQDFISIDLKSALMSLEEITGEAISEEILDNIFTNFCIGK